ncbi:UPF0271 protein [Parapedobacter composti]|uniref:UPF0271 protein n=1 Tax=Parapedobacter composti TaxID=623281 RepID=A0A1I1KPE6_9SPHI|nr:5-oxoprolinase subunit PxpA [Parapedobacter composti]SFC62475.1 UPF0271 protein [Parapedobacter composti]
MKTIDLNCDIGETPGNEPNTAEEALIAQVSSVNIACGFHAGDPQRMELTVRSAIRHRVAIGAHPGLPDREGFGRRELPVSADEVYQITLYQIGALYSFTKAAGGSLHHVKAHGALYNMAARNRELAEALVTAVYDFDPCLFIYALDGSEMVKVAREKGLRVATEGFIDRAYEPDGTLTPRNVAGAVIEDMREATGQALLLADKLDTLCLHSDGIHALPLIGAVRDALNRAGIRIKAPGSLDSRPL